MSVDEGTVRRIAKLSRLAIEESRVKPMVAELNGLLAWVEQLSEVDVTGVPAMTSVVEQNLKMREDVVTDGGNADALVDHLRSPEGAWNAGEADAVVK